MENKLTRPHLAHHLPYSQPAIFPSFCFCLFPFLFPYIAAHCVAYLLFFPQSSDPLPLQLFCFLTLKSVLPRDVSTFVNLLFYSSQRWAEERGTIWPTNYPFHLNHSRNYHNHHTTHTTHTSTKFNQAVYQSTCTNTQKKKEKEKKKKRKKENQKPIWGSTPVTSHCAPSDSIQSTF